MTNILREKLAAGKRLSGFEIDLAEPCISEVVGSLGYDFLWIDTEHQAMDYETVLMHIIACKAGGTASIVRVPYNESYLAKRVLEMGPDGIIFPMINSAAEAQAAMDACLYPPLGKRGFGPRRACRYGAEDLSDYIREAKDRTVRLIQIEHIDGVNNLDEILKVPYIDGIIVGPCDLSGSVGKLNMIFDPEVLDLIDTIISKCRSANIPVGIAIGATSETDIRFWFERGFQFISSGTDMSAIVTLAKAQYEMMQRVISEGSE